MEQLNNILESAIQNYSKSVYIYTSYHKRPFYLRINFESRNQILKIFKP